MDCFGIRAPSASEAKGPSLGQEQRSPSGWGTPGCLSCVLALVVMLSGFSGYTGPSSVDKKHP